MKKIIHRVEEWKDFAQALIDQFPQGVCLGLEGDLGVGKTTLVRAIVDRLYHQTGQTVPRIISPTFVLHQRYDAGKVPLDHFDLYRLTAVDTNTALEIGLIEAIDKQVDRGGYLFVEWPDRISDPQLKPRQTLYLSFGPQEAREVQLR